MIAVRLCEVEGDAPLASSDERAAVSYLIALAVVESALVEDAIERVRSIIARVGLATNKPAEFIILRISQDTRALEAELARLVAAVEGT